MLLSHRLARLAVGVGSRCLSSSHIYGCGVKGKTHEIKPTRTGKARPYKVGHGINKLECLVFSVDGSEERNRGNGLEQEENFKMDGKDDDKNIDNSSGGTAKARGISPIRRMDDSGAVDEGKTESVRSFLSSLDNPGDQNPERSEAPKPPPMPRPSGSGSTPAKRPGRFTKKDITNHGRKKEGWTTKVSRILRGATGKKLKPNVSGDEELEGVKAMFRGPLDVSRASNGSTSPSGKTTCLLYTSDAADE